MHPAIKAGDVVVGEPLGGKAAVPGEAVLLRGGAGQPIVHRVLARRRAREGRVLITGGDAARGLDRVVPESDVLARVVMTERAGSPIPVGRRTPGLGRRLRAWWQLLLCGRVGPRHPVRALPSLLLWVPRRVADALRAAFAASRPTREAARELVADVRSVRKWRWGEVHIVRLRRGWYWIGSAYVWRAYRRELGLETWWITDLYTRPSWRGLGVGRRAVEKCLDVARQQGIAEVFAAINVANGPSLSVFASVGFRRAEDADLDEAVSRVHKRLLCRAPSLVVFSRKTGPPAAEASNPPS